MSQAARAKSESESAPQIKNRGRQSGAKLDDDSILAEIKEESKPEELKTFDVKPLFHLVEDILNQAIQNVNSSVMDTRAYMEDKTHREEVIRMCDKFTYKMDQISYEIAYNTSSSVDPHKTLISIFKILSGYSWESKLLLTLTAFALNYGESWHFALIYSSTQLAKSMAILKQVADVRKQPGLSAPPLEAVNDLVKAMMDVTRCIIEFQELGGQLDKKLEQYSAGLNHIPITIYWTIRSVLASASQITSLTSMGFNYVISSTEKEELMFLTEKLNKKKEKLKEYQKLCHPILEEVRMKKRQQIIKRLIEDPQVDNMNILRALIYYKDDQEPLLDGSNNKVSLNVLRKKLVMLLISDLDIPQEDIEIIKQIYNSSDRKAKPAETQFEIVWLPIVNSPSEPKMEKFEQKQRDMPWYTVLPSLIAQEVIKLTKEEWHFEKQPIIVVIDAQGQVACPNAIPMIKIWRNQAYPFTTGAEEALWKENTWNLEFLINDICPEILTWMRSGKCICLYGGEDMEWIKMFTTRAPSVEDSLKMVYVGKSSEPKQQVHRHIETIEKEKLSQFLTKEEQSRFWARIVNMGHSRMQLGKTIYGDTILQDIISLLNLDASGGGWAVLFRGSDLIIKAKGKHILYSLINFVEWKDNVRKKDFISALEDHLIMNPGHTDVIKHIMSYEKIINDFERSHKIDCTRVLKALISPTNHWQPLFDGATNKRVNLDILRKKELLLLVSDLDILPKELTLLKGIYNELHKRTSEQETQYEIVWLPILDQKMMRHNEIVQEKFEKLKAEMPWYIVYHPSIIDQAGIRFIKEVWHFDHQTILVVLNQQGRVESPNALNMMWIWGNLAFPFTTSMEESLWKDLSWRHKLLMVDVDQSVKNCISDDKLICFYGGEARIDWIRKFTRTVNDVVKSLNFPLEMIYVGKNNYSKKKKQRNIIQTIIKEKLSRCWEDSNLISQFWNRIECMWNSIFQLRRNIPEYDSIIRELNTILNSNEEGWVIMSKGSEPGEMAIAKGSEFLECLLNFNQWKSIAMQKGFLKTLEEKLIELRKHKSKNCYQLVLPAADFSEPTKCSLCTRIMERFNTFECCG